jgi:hypothetical protein
MNVSVDYEIRLAVFLVHEVSFPVDPLGDSLSRL